MIGSITLEQIITWVGGGSSLTIMTIMWWRAEMRANKAENERIALQRLLLGFLPTARSMARTNRAISKVLVPDGIVEEGEEG